MYSAIKVIFGDRAHENEPMARHTTFRVGGNADICIFPNNIDEIKFVCSYMEAKKAPCMVIGNGSNLIVRDGGIRGAVMILGDNFSEITVNRNIITAQAGASLKKLSQTALDNSLTGLEFASGIPGSVGGGTAMNAGAYGGQLSDCLVSADVLSNGKILTYSFAEMEMGYRTTRPLRNGEIILSATFALSKGNPDEISAKMRDLNAQRREKQPLNLPSAGSVFKRPEGYFAGALIEQAGLKGVSVGGAQVSEKHAGFIVNIGGATAKDITDLIKLVQDMVYENSGVRLETEVRIVGED